MILLALLYAVQDAVEIKTNDETSTPRVRFSATAGASARLKGLTELDVSSNKISNLATAALSADAVRFDQLGSINGPFVQLSPSSVQAWSNNNIGIYLNETGTGTPKLMELQSAGTARLIVDNTGAITTGTWSASTIAVNKGGTGTTSLSSNQFLWYNGSDLISSGYDNDSFLARHSADTFAG